MDNADRLVAEILAYLEGRIDPAQLALAAQRQRATLDFAPVDRLPLVLYLPYEGTAWRPFPYHEAFADPAKMMANELLAGFVSLYQAADLPMDAPYCLRPNLGTGLIASQFGAEIRLVEDNPPWTMPLGSEERLRALVESPLPPATSGLAQRALEQYAYFDRALAAYPNCRAAFWVTLPDLQGPFSTAELLWGSAIYPAMYEEPDLVRGLMERITEQMLTVYRLLMPHVHEDAQPGYTHQHGVAIKGNVLVRNDSIINLSPALYRDMVQPFDAQLARDLGAIGVHFCGRGQHQVPNLLAIPGIASIDIGNPEMLDLDMLYQHACAQRVPLLRVAVPAEELRASRLLRRFPTGVTLCYTPTSVAEARALWGEYIAG
jgi:hypothetical protein